MWWDTHCHYTDERLADISNHVKRAHLAGVDHIVIPSTDLEDAKQAAKLSELHQLFFAAGIHPHEAGLLSPDDIDSFAELMSLEHCVAVGEIGLDYHYMNQEKTYQKQVFESMMMLAQQKSLPVVLHTRSAEADVFDMVCQFPSIIGVCHSYTGEVQLLEKFLDKGYYVSFNGMITFPKSNNIRDLVKYAPMDRILLETDAPYLAPVPHRGKTNSPELIPIIGAALAEIKLLSIDRVAEQTSMNANQLFLSLK